MRKYKWSVNYSILFHRNEYWVSFCKTSEWTNKKALPKRRLIDNLKVLMFAPIGFYEIELGVRINEQDYLVYDYNVKEKDRVKWKL